MFFKSKEETVAALLERAGITLNGNESQDIQVYNPEIFSRVLAGGSVAAGESYMDGWWDSEQMDHMFTALINSRFDFEIEKALGLVLQALGTKFVGTFRNLQSVVLSERVGREHYDLGNDLFENMLDPWMQYTCAYWDRGTCNLSEAQRNKLRLIGEKLKLRRGMQVLDVGSGWGGLAIYLAKNYGVHVTGISISNKQIAYAKAWAEREGVTDKVKFVFCDYRKMPKHWVFDRIVSVGMFEQVGFKNLKTFFKGCYDHLSFDGLLLLHTITVTGSGGNGIDPWLEKYIFRGGQLVQLAHLMPFFNGNDGGFWLQDLHQFGQDYDKTLQAWWRNFETTWPELRASGKYDESFYRMWKYYLHLCMATFRSGRTQLVQFVGSKRSDEKYVSVR